MGWQLTLPSLILLVMTITTVVAAWLIWPRRKMPGGIYLFWLLIMGAEWTLASGLEAATRSLTLKILFSQVSYIGVLCATALLLLFSLDYTSETKWVTPRNLVFLATAPAIILILAFTNRWHHLVWTNFIPIPGTTQIAYIHGPIFWLFLAYIGLCSLIAMIVFLRSFRQAGQIYRLQLTIIVLSTLLPWTGTLLYLVGYAPIPGLDITAVGFSLSAIIISLGTLQFRFLDLVPIARTTLIETMSDGILVVDTNNRLLDANPAALKMFKLSSDLIGQDAIQALMSFPVISAALAQKQTPQLEVEFDEKFHFFADVRVAPILSNRGRLTGHLIVARDITERKRAEAALETKRQELEQLATIDELTGIYNRRHINAILEREYGRAKRYGHPLSVGLFDVDNFKTVNDTSGHLCGDAVLHAIAMEVAGSIRSVDVAGRMGGDEFIIIFPDTTIDNAWTVLERIRIRLSKINFVCTGLHVTISGGVVAWHDGDTPVNAIKRVDKLLYQAKESGKDKICREGTPPPPETQP
jgi:diguanylate cyclase (GGDEF)-like protein/PAS domain S-box-containing protein